MLLTSLLALWLAAPPVAPVASAALTYDPAFKVGYRPGAILLKPEKPEGVKKEPAYRATPLYGVLSIGTGPKAARIGGLDEPEHEPWKSKVTLEEGKLTTVAIPALAKAVAKPAATEGTLKVTTQANAQILLDSTVIGTGATELKVKAGGHTLRVTAPGMRPYQSEIVVGVNELRTIDVPLDKEIVASGNDGPGFEVGATLGGGIKARGGNPMMVMLRVEAALRLGRRVNFGVFAEYGSIDTGDHCGFNMPGPFPTTDFDFGPRNQFHRCSYFMPGLQLFVHIRPKEKLDPYVGIAPGFRFGFTEWTQYAAGIPGEKQSELFPGVVLGLRGGVNYHPRPQVRAWQVGGYVGADVTLIGQETSSKTTSNSGETSVSVVAGMRSTLQF